MEASPINAPHPDDEAGAQAEQFFDEPQAEVADPGEFDPVSGGFPSAEQRAEEARRYREEKGEAEPEPRGWPEPEVGEPSPAAATPQEQAAEATEEAQDATDGPETGEDPASLDAAPEGAESAGAEEDKPRGSIEREYIVFQKLVLTESMLKQWIMDMEAGRMPEPHVAYVEISRVLSRNDRGAVVETYKRHEARLGERCSLAAVSARSFKERSIAPEEVPTERRLRIS